MSGNRQFLPIGEYNVDSLYKNDDVSSISVSPSTKAELYGDDNFGGFKFETLVDIAELPVEINDKVSSIKVLPVWACILYSEPLYGGTAQVGFSLISV